MVILQISATEAAELVIEVSRLAIDFVHVYIT